MAIRGKSVVNQRSSEAIIGHPWQSKVIRGNQRSSVAIRCHQRRSEVIRCNQMSSEVIRGHPWQSDVIRGNQRSRPPGYSPKDAPDEGGNQRSSVVNQRSLEAISGHDRQGTLRWMHLMMEAIRGHQRQSTARGRSDGRTVRNSAISSTLSCSASSRTSARSTCDGAVLSRRSQ